MLWKGKSFLQFNIMEFYQFEIWQMVCPSYTLQEEKKLQYLKLTWKERGIVGDNCYPNAS